MDSNYVNLVYRDAGGAAQPQCGSLMRPPRFRPEWAYGGGPL